MSTATKKAGPSDAHPELPLLNPLEWGVLQACREITLRQQELFPALAALVGVPVTNLLHAWALGNPKPRQHGPLREADWFYFFHGFECDLKNTADGRFLRIDFGPRGRTDTFTAWGVLQFIMTSCPPWPEYPELQAAFAERGPPYDQYSGSLTKICTTWDSLEARGVFGKADPELLEFQARYSKVGPDGITYTRFPAETSMEISIDCAVAHRPCLSAQGLKLLSEQPVRMARFEH